MAQRTRIYPDGTINYRQRERGMIAGVVWQGRAKWAVVGFLIAGIILAVVSAVMWQTQQQYAAEGVPAQAEILRTDRQLGTRNRADTFYVYYTYEVDNQAYEGRQSISRMDYNAMRAGEPIEVMYLASNPAESQLASQTSSALPLVFVGLAVVWNIGTLIGAVVVFLLPRLRGQESQAV